MDFVGEGVMTFLNRRFLRCRTWLSSIVKAKSSKKKGGTTGKIIIGRSESENPVQLITRLGHSLFPQKITGEDIEKK